MKRTSGQKSGKVNDEQGRVLDGSSPSQSQPTIQKITPAQAPLPSTRNCSFELFRLKTRIY